MASPTRGSKADSVYSSDFEDDGSTAKGESRRATVTIEHRGIDVSPIPSPSGSLKSEQHPASLQRKAFPPVYEEGPSVSERPSRHRCDKRECSAEQRHEISEKGETRKYRDIADDSSFTVEPPELLVHSRREQHSKRQDECSEVLEQMCALETRLQEDEFKTKATPEAKVVAESSKRQDRNFDCTQAQVSRETMNPLPVLENMELTLAAMSQELTESARFNQEDSYSLHDDRENEQYQRQAELAEESRQPLFTLHGQVNSVSDLPHNRTVPINPSVKVFQVPPGKKHVLLRPRRPIHQTLFAKDSANPSWDSSFQCTFRAGGLLLLVYANICSEAYYLGHAHINLSQRLRGTQTSALPLINLSGERLGKKCSLSVKLTTHPNFAATVPRPISRNALLRCVASAPVSEINTDYSKTPTQKKVVDIAFVVRQRQKLHGIAQRNKAQRQVERENEKMAKRIQAAGSTTKKGKHTALKPYQPCRVVYDENISLGTSNSSISNRPDWAASSMAGSAWQLRPDSAPAFRHKMNYIRK
jgi:hypothetical protein